MHASYLLDVCSMFAQSRKHPIKLLNSSLIPYSVFNGSWSLNEVPTIILETQSGKQCTSWRMKSFFNTIIQKLNFMPISR